MIRDLVDSLIEQIPGYGNSPSRAVYERFIKSLDRIVSQYYRDIPFAEILKVEGHLGEG